MTEKNVMLNGVADGRDLSVLCFNI